MILLTTTLTPTGYRLIATTTYGAVRYRWSFYRNDIPLLSPCWTDQSANAVTIDLHHPVLPGAYWVQVDHFSALYNRSTKQPQAPAQYKSKAALLPFLR